MSNIQKAIQEHGARAVYEAATHHMAGDTARGLASVGLSATTMGQVFAVQTEAYKQLGEADKAIDYASAGAELEQIVKRGRRPVPVEDRKTARVELRVHPDTKAAWQAAADAAGLSLSAWAEARLNDSARGGVA